MKKLILLMVFAVLLSSFACAGNETIGIQKIMSSGDTVTVNVNGAQAVVNLVGVNSDALTAMITINGESKQLSQGQTETLGGVRVYLKSIYSYPVVMKSGAVLYIGNENTSAENPPSQTTPPQNIQPQSNSVSETIVMTAGDSKTITDPSGKPFVLQVVGVNSDSMTAMITANGESRQISEGELFTKEPFNIYLVKIHYRPGCVVCDQVPVELDVVDTETDNKNTLNRVFVPGDEYSYFLKNGNSFKIKIIGVDENKGLVGVEINNIAYSLKKQKFTDLADVRVSVKQIFTYVMGPPGRAAAELSITDKTIAKQSSGDSEAKPNIQLNFTKNEESIYITNKSRYLDTFYLNLYEEKEIIINKTPRKLKLTFFDSATGLSILVIDGQEYNTKSGSIIELEDSLISLDKVYVSKDGYNLAYFKILGTKNTLLYEKTRLNSTKIQCFTLVEHVANSDSINLSYSGDDYFFGVDAINTGTGDIEIAIENHKTPLKFGQTFNYKDFEIEYSGLYLWLSKIPVAVFDVTTCYAVQEPEQPKQEVNQEITAEPDENNNPPNVIIEPKTKKTFWEKITNFFRNLF